MSYAPAAVAGRRGWALALALTAACRAAPLDGNPPPAGFVAAVGERLAIDGAPFRFVGANRYDVASFPPGSGKYYCGNAYSDAQLDELMEELAVSSGATVLRTWAFQRLTDGASDFSTLDRAIATARRYGLRLILTLENQWSDCTEPDPASPDGRKSSQWYAAGYRAPLGGDALSYRDYAQTLVARYRDEPTIAMWQLMNEAQSDDAAALLAFTTDMAATVKQVDGAHLLSLGTIGSGQPGTNGDAYRALHAVDGIDVVEAHDYGNELVALPPAIAADLADAGALGKPFFLGEAGIPAPSPMYPFSYATRAQAFDAKLAAHFRAGSDGFLVWSFYDLKADNLQGWDYAPTDPLAAVLAKYAAIAP